MILRNIIFEAYNSEFMRIKSHLINLDDEKYIDVITTHKDDGYMSEILLCICMGWRYGKGKSVNRDVLALIENLHNV